MANFRILNTGSNLPDVLLYRNRDENGQESVNIMAVGIIEDTENMFAEEKVIFENHISARQFIKDFTIKSAEQWCENQEITYAG
jgi:hypothetical protein